RASTVVRLGRRVGTAPRSGRSRTAQCCGRGSGPQHARPWSSSTRWRAPRPAARVVSWRHRSGRYVAARLGGGAIEPMRWITGLDLLIGRVLAPASFPARSEAQGWRSTGTWADRDICYYDLRAIIRFENAALLDVEVGVLRPAMTVLVEGRRSAGALRARRVRRPPQGHLTGRARWNADHP